MTKVIYILSMLLMVWVCGNAQSLEIVVQKGHSGDIYNVVFSGDGKLLATAASDNQIKLWHVQTGKEMASFVSASPQAVKSLSFSRSKDLLYVLYEDKQVHAWNIQTSKLSSKKVVEKINFSSKTSYYSNRNSLRATIDRYYLRQSDTTSGKTLFSRVPVDISNNFTSVAVSEDNDLLLASNEDKGIYAFSWKTGKSRGVLTEHLSDVNQVCFNPNGTLFASVSSDRSVILWDSKTLKPIDRLFSRTTRIETLVFNHAGTNLVVGDERGRIRKFDLMSSRLTMQTYKFHSRKITDIEISADDSLVLSTSYDNNLVISAAADGEHLYESNRSAAPPDSKSMSQEFHDPQRWINSVSANPSGSLIAFGGSSREAIPRDKPVPITLTHWPRKTRDKLLSHRGGVNQLLFLNDFNFVSIRGKSILSWFYETSERVYYYHQFSIPSAGDLTGIVSGPNELLILNSEHQIFIYDHKKNVLLDSVKTEGQVTSIAFDPTTRRICYAEGNSLKISSIDDVHKVLTTIEMAHHDRITGIAFNPSHPILATTSWDTTIKLWRTTDASLVATVVPIGSDDFIVITPDNYYYGTKSSLKGIGFKLGNEFISPEQFDLKFNRPDIVFDRLGFTSPKVIQAFNRAYKKRLQNMDFTEEMLGTSIHLPETEILTHDLPRHSTNELLSFDVKVNDSEYNIDRLNVFVNNTPIFGFKGVDLREKQVREFVQSITVTLSEGLNIIQVSCLNEKGTESYLETFQVDYSPEKKMKPDLYIVAISVSSYMNTSMNLKYAKKDGRDIIKAFTKKNDLFSRIVVDSLFDESVTRENILLVKEKLLKTSVNDHVILFVAGHGLLDENYDFYFATHDIDFDRPATRGIRYDEIESLLDGIPSRSKLLLIDACHSGDLDKGKIIAAKEKSTNRNARGVTTIFYYPEDFGNEYNDIGSLTSFELMKEVFSNLNKGTGAVVVSAAAGTSYALESDEWKNGVFTFSVLNGLKSRKADLNRDRKITVTELREYVSREVVKLTDGAQKPTSRRENIVFDFRIW